MKQLHMNLNVLINLDCYDCLWSDWYLSELCVLQCNLKDLTISALQQYSDLTVLGIQVLTITKFIYRLFNVFRLKDLDHSLLKLFTCFYCSILFGYAVNNDSLWYFIVCSFLTCVKDITLNIKLWNLSTLSPYKYLNSYDYYEIRKSKKARLWMLFLYRQKSIYFPL